MNGIIQLKITLDETEPPIWRRVLVDKQTTFFELHHIIQIAMGWENCHLYEFNFNNYRIGDPDEEFVDFGFGRDKLLDASDVTLGSLITDTKEKFSYEYDFGDGWRHNIAVEKFLFRNNMISCPTCIDGQLNCPPEDCGGVLEFYDLLDIIANKQNPERKDMLVWLGGSYDPEYFDKDEVNKELKKIAKYINDWTEDE